MLTPNDLHRSVRHVTYWWRRTDGSKTLIAAGSRKADNDVHARNLADAWVLRGVRLGTRVARRVPVPNRPGYERLAVISETRVIELIGPEQEVRHAAPDHR